MFTQLGLQFPIACELRTAYPLGESLMSAFAPNTPFEKSRWRLFFLLAIQGLVTVILAGGLYEKGAMLVVAGISLVAVLTKRPWYAKSERGRGIIVLLLMALTAAALAALGISFSDEVKGGAVDGGFSIWLAPLAAGVIAIADWDSSLHAEGPPTL